MAMDTITLKSAIKAAFLANLSSPDTVQTDQVDTMAGAIANAMRDFVVGATITYTAGLVAPSGGGPVTGVFTNIIS